MRITRTPACYPARNGVFAIAAGSLKKLDPKGKVLWEAQIPPERSPCRYYDLATYASGNVFALGRASTSGLVQFGKGVTADFSKH